jgi:hypothetical protein
MILFLGRQSAGNLRQGRSSKRERPTPRMARLNDQNEMKEGLNAKAHPLEGIHGPQADLRAAISVISHGRCPQGHLLKRTAFAVR